MQFLIVSIVLQAPKDAAVKWSEKQSTVYTGRTPPGEKKGDFTIGLFTFQLFRLY